MLRFSRYHLPSTYRQLLKFVAKFFPNEIIKSLALGVLVSITSVLISLVSGNIFKHLFEINKKDHSAILISSFIFIFCFSLIACIHDLHLKKLNLKILSMVISSVWSNTLNLPIKLSSRFTSAELSQRISDYELSLSNCTTLTLSLFLNLSASFILLAYFIYLSKLLSCIFFCIFIIFIAIRYFSMSYNLRYKSEQLNGQAKQSSILNEILLQIQKIRSANAESLAFRNWLNVLLKVKKTSEKLIRLEIFTYLIEALIPLIFLLSFYSVVYFSLSSINTNIVLQYIIFSAQLVSLQEKLAADFVSLSTLLPGLQRIKPLIGKKQNNELNKKTLSSMRGEITFKNVALKNKKTGRDILNDVCLDIPSGSFVALVGKSGSGKSSLFKLLIGLESPNSGEITIDGNNLSDLNLKKLRKTFGVVLQNTNIMPGTIFSNIAENNHISLDEAWELARYVDLDKEIENMPMKMYTYISDNTGESISGGQKQKILIARALAAKPKILLLDEATSALDNISQATIHKNLKKLNITRFVIAHRHSTIVDADVIYVLDQGRIISNSLETTAKLQH